VLAKANATSSPGTPREHALTELVVTTVVVHDAVVPSKSSGFLGVTVFFPATFKSLLEWVSRHTPLRKEVLEMLNHG
jgi:hypothetical protein